MEIVIPKSFKIFGLTYKVTQPVKVDDEGSWGEHSIEHRKIKILKSLNEQQKEITYLHELIHTVLDNLEYNELSSDEVFVERVSKALHQILTTSK